MLRPSHVQLCSWDFSGKRSASREVVGHSLGISRPIQAMGLIATLRQTTCIEVAGTVGTRSGVCQGGATFLRRAEVRLSSSLRLGPRTAPRPSGRVTATELPLANSAAPSTDTATRADG